MNIFTALAQIIKAANENYRESQEDKQLYNMRQEAIIQERRSKALLKEKLEELIEVINVGGYTGLLIEISKECEPYISEVMQGVDAELTPLNNGRYLLQVTEEELS